MDVLLSVFFGLLGLAIGSFLNVCIDRLPVGKSLIFPSSHCDACGHPLTVKDNIPVLSYLMLRGRCRYCGIKIPQRVFWVELGSGLFLALVYWHSGLSTQFVLNAFFGFIFILIGVIDLEHQLILNKIVYPAAVLALLVNFIPGQPGIVSGLIGGAIGLAFFLVVAIVSRGGMGLGDAKMAGLIGILTGFPLVLLAILAGVILGGLVAAILLLTGVKKKKEAIPFGPFLSVSTIITLFWGSRILHWYLGIFGIG